MAYTWLGNLCSKGDVINECFMQQPDKKLVYQAGTLSDTHEAPCATRDIELAESRPRLFDNSIAADFIVAFCFSFFALAKRALDVSFLRSEALLSKALPSVAAFRDRSACAG